MFECVRHDARQMNHRAIERPIDQYGFNHDQRDEEPDKGADDRRVRPPRHRLPRDEVKKNPENHRGDAKCRSEQLHGHSLRPHLSTRGSVSSGAVPLVYRLERGSALNSLWDDPRVHDEPLREQAAAMTAVLDPDLLQRNGRQVVPSARQAFGEAPGAVAYQASVFQGVSDEHGSGLMTGAYDYRMT